MKNFLLFVGGLSAVVVYLLVRGAKEVATQAPPVVELAHRLEEAWADHHTVV